MIQGCTAQILDLNQQIDSAAEREDFETAGVLSDRVEKLTAEISMLEAEMADA